MPPAQRSASSVPVASGPPGFDGPSHPLSWGVASRRVRHRGMDGFGLGLGSGLPRSDQAPDRLAGQPVGDRTGDEHGPGSTGQSSGDITRSHHRQTKSARAPAALRRAAAAAAAANHVRSTTVVGAASSSCLLRHALSPVTDRTASTRSSPLLPLDLNCTSNSGSSTIPHRMQPDPLADRSPPRRIDSCCLDPLSGINLNSSEKHA